MDALRAVQIFVRAAQARSFTQAARDLRMTPQAVSSQVRGLEQLVGVRLFNRSTRQINLTADGAQLFSRCHDGIGAIEHGLRELIEAADEAVGDVRVAVPYGLSHSVITPLLEELLEQYPRIRVELLVQNEIPDLVAQGVDIGIIGGALPGGALVARKITTFDQVLCASPRYLARYGTPKRIEDLRHHRCVNLRHPRTGKVQPWSFRRGTEVATLDIAGCLTVNDTETQRRAVLNGAGIGQLASFFVAPNHRAGLLQPLLLEYASPPIDLFIYMPPHGRLPKRTSVVADFFFQKMRLNQDLRPMSRADPADRAPVRAAPARRRRTTAGQGQAAGQG